MVRLERAIPGATQKTIKNQMIENFLAGSLNRAAPEVDQICNSEGARLKRAIPGATQMTKSNQMIENFVVGSLNRAAPEVDQTSK